MFVVRGGRERDQLRLFRQRLHAVTEAKLVEVGLERKRADAIPVFPREQVLIELILRRQPRAVDGFRALQDRGVLGVASFERGERDIGPFGFEATIPQVGRAQRIVAHVLFPRLVHERAQLGCRGRSQILLSHGWGHRTAQEQWQPEPARHPYVHRPWASLEPRRAQRGEKHYSRESREAITPAAAAGRARGALCRDDSDGFFLRRQLGSGGAEPDRLEDRVIAEPARATRLSEHAAFPRAMRDQRRRIVGGAHECDDALIVPRPTFRRNIAQLVEQLQQIGLIGRMLAGISRRIHTRPTVERIDLDARVVGNRRKARELRRVARFQQRVLGEGHAGLQAVCRCRAKFE